MLILNRPRQTWIPYGLPPNRTQQAAYNREMQEQFESTRRVAPAVPLVERDPLDALKDLARLHRSGLLTDAEFEDVKSKLLAR